MTPVLGPRMAGCSSSAAWAAAGGGTTCRVAKACPVGSNVEPQGGG
ncbi:hypothetical protein [Methylobacterium oryzisoli]